jgi:uncharacterized protein
MLRARSRPLPVVLYGAVIGTLGGLIGLGGAEFRLPVLVGSLGYAAKQAVPLNLAISLVTLVTALAIRSGTLSLASILPYIPAVVGMIAGAMVTAFVGATLAHRLSRAQLERIILVLLVGIGTLLIVEAFLPTALPGLVTGNDAARLVVGIVFGLGIGLVSSMLGVAGGELIIPTLIFVFGADIKTAGTGSLIVSIPTVIVGITRYAMQGAYQSREDWTQAVAPMGVGSVVGATIGGALVGLIPLALLKLALGIILNVSALRMFRQARSG